MYNDTRIVTCAQEALAFCDKIYHGEPHNARTLLQALGHLYMRVKHQASSTPRGVGSDEHTLYSERQRYQIEATLHATDEHPTSFIMQYSGHRQHSP